MFVEPARTLIASDAFERLRRARAEEPERITAALATRGRRPIIRGDGRLFLVAADHPARGSLGVGRDPMAMADRYELLGRLALALSHPLVDGVLGTPDIIDDLAFLDALDDKLVAASMNRGGLRGSAFEMDDRFTGYDVASAALSGADFVKVLTRVNLSDAGTVATLEATARAVSEAATAELSILIEPFLSEWRDGEIVNDLSPDAVITSIAIAAGLGSSSSRTWLKLPVVAEMERVMAATTMPTLLLGGDPSLGRDEMFSSWQAALALPGVRGLVVGRSLLYPPDGDVWTAVDTAAGLVHG